MTEQTTFTPDYDGDRLSSTATIACLWCHQPHAAHGPAEAGPVRQAEWGHWGITFFWGVPDAYAPSRIEGTLMFPCGSQGPQDGCLGSPERQRYADAIKAWREQGTLPEGLQRQA